MKYHKTRNYEMNYIANFIIRGLLVALGFELAAAQIWAASITGRVVDSNSGSYIVSASVTDVNSGQKVYSDREGRFRLDGLDKGTTTLKVISVGYDTKMQEVSVPGSGSVEAEIALGSEAEALEGFVVKGYREGFAKALQYKRSATNLLDVISADSAGHLPDYNIGDALARLPGVSLTQESGEALFVQIRGMEPSLNTITLNGGLLAPPSIRGRTGRATPFESLLTAQISQVEVAKTITSDMDANSIGGQVNITTPSGFDREKRFIGGSIEGGFILDNSDLDNFKTDFIFTDVFGKDRTFGVGFTATYSDRDTLNDRIETGSYNTLEDGTVVLRSVRYNPKTTNREKLGFTLNLDWRPNENVNLYFRGLLNSFEESSVEPQGIYSARGATTFPDPSNRNIAQHEDAFYEIRVEELDRERDLTNGQIGGSIKFGAFTVSSEFLYSRAEDNWPRHQAFHFRTNTTIEDANIIFDTTNFIPTFDDNGTLSPVNRAQHDLNRIWDDLLESEERLISPRLDVRYDFPEQSGYAKVGFKYVERDHFLNRTTPWYNSNPANPRLTLADFPDTALPNFTFLDGQIPFITFQDMDKLFEYRFANPDLFAPMELQTLQNGIKDDNSITEKITAAYAMVSYNVTPKLNVLAGFRYEETDSEFAAFQFFTDRDTGERSALRVDSSSSFRHFLPNVQFRYEFNDQIVFRGSVTETIGRQPFEAMAPIGSFTIEPFGSVNADVLGILRIGNEDLDPFESTNIDLSVDFYLKRGGAFSVAFFHKDLDNPIFNFTESVMSTEFQGIALDELRTSTKRNSQDATVTGVEFLAQMPFSMFTSNGFIGAFGVNATATLISSRVNVFERPGEDLPLFQQPDEIINLEFYYQKGRFQGRVAYNSQSESLIDVRGNELADRWRADRYFLDMQVSYQFHKNFTVYANWQNITDQGSERYLLKDKSKFNEVLHFGSTFRTGLRYHF